MTGIKRLRALAGAWDEWGLGGTLAEMADQIERELREERDRWDSELCEAQMDKSRVTAVYLEMNKHVLGHEGMEDSPVARWARELREALGGSVTDEDREAAAWVRERGGLDYVKGEWRSRVPYDRYVRKRQSLLGHIAECETALGRRNRRIEELGHRVGDLTRENAEMRKRAMPEGMEWPRYESGDLVMFGDCVENRNGTCTVKSVRFYSGGGVTVYGEGRGAQFVVVTEPVMHDPIRKARPKVLAADGEPLEAGQTVWNEVAVEFKVEEINPRNKSFNAISDFDGSRFDGLNPMCFTHRRPVLDAGGVPIREGDTVWHIETGREYVVVEPSYGETVVVRLAKYDDAEGEQYAPDKLTHTKPEIDSWERVEEDAENVAKLFDSFDADASEDIRAIVRCCRALAERERGE